MYGGVRRGTVEDVMDLLDTKPMKEPTEIVFRAWIVE